jgi:hypothetical protein
MHRRPATGNVAASASRPHRATQRPHVVSQERTEAPALGNGARPRRMFDDIGLWRIIGTTGAFFTGRGANTQAILS